MAPSSPASSPSASCAGTASTASTSSFSPARIRIRSPFDMPARSAAPPGNTALTCCRGAYSSPLMLRSWPPSLT
ncbi:hypothetical protein CRUP_002160 [Coryphaenoides rupestris]|nr:hypothetical protein CRUP_002160 [Coryphaenoides rupestris]